MIDKTGGVCMSKKHGFTIIELLVVVAIIMILAALLTPVIQKAREQGRRAACISNIRQMSQAAMLYAADWRDKLPPVANTTALYAVTLLGKYTTNDPKLLKCPNELTATYSYGYYSGASLADDHREPLFCETTHGNNTWTKAGNDNHGDDGGTVGYVGGNAEFYPKTARPTHSREGSGVTFVE
jgi:prepilin-type N-terminal cleavage/methylation domain-containing protein